MSNATLAGAGGGWSGGGMSRRPFRPPCATMDDSWTPRWSDSSRRRPEILDPRSSSPLLNLQSPSNPQSPKRTPNPQSPAHPSKPQLLLRRRRASSRTVSSRLSASIRGGSGEIRRNHSAAESATPPWCRREHGGASVAHQRRARGLPVTLGASRTGPPAQRSAPPPLRPRRAPGCAVGDGLGRVAQRGCGGADHVP